MEKREIMLYISITEDGRGCLEEREREGNVFSLVKELKDYLGEDCQYMRSIPGYIKRGYMCPYINNEEDCLQEYKYSELLYEKESKWQNIKIYKTENCGNLLALDDDIMIGESDLIYSKTLLGIGKNNFKDKRVLILGGGDGGILNELLMEKPKYVIMVEIDEEVIKACRNYMRKVCKDSMDNYKGDNYEIIIDDCVNVMRQCVENNTKFDYVINDLTEFCVEEGVGHSYDYENTNTILDLSIKVLKQDGKYLSRGNTVDAKEYLARYEKCMKNLSLDFQKTEIIVPSFNSPYWIYEAWRTN
ncbi:hypothetical protein KUTeg_000543 [Tegillarca granosa]|uniref:PABS domain-containing protein n=1 Tax=Tegillarca granosa TaxID=220873 RepID=A0ABQ9FXT6_TEGGR|nr:hypothetical protein KUTeg_000543 [Tegillarca granosa]